MNIRLNPIKIIIISILSIIVLIWKASAFEETININGLSWDYWKEDYNNYLVPIMSNIEYNLGIEEYVKKIQTINQEWEDLNLYTVDNNWNITHQTLMDRNMWATETYNKKFNTDEINAWSFWYHYQWWNKYWFKPCISLWGTCNTFPWWEIIAEKSLWNVIRISFIWTFSNNVWNNLYVIEDIPYENFSIWLIWYSHAPYSKRIRQQMGENLWWWYWDTKTSNGNGSFEWQDILDNTIQSHANRQWPCPNNYHIPSIAERNEIFTSWANARSFSSAINENTFEEIFWEQFSVDLLLPPAWIREDNSNIQNQWIKGAYRSSSPMDYYIGDTYNNYRGTLARYITISKSYLWLDNEDYSGYGNGLSLRCIKNTNNQWIKIYPNWWTNAIIITVWDKITTLSNPSRNWCTFGWRYTDSDFPEYSLISPWSEIYNNAILYAKWIWENCWRSNTQQQNCTSLPENAQWINSKFTQTWDGISWAPSSHENTYTSDSNIECSFKCNTNYTRNSNTQECIFDWNWWGNPDSYKCTDLPENATANNSGIPEDSDKKYSYSTNTGEICTFQCNNNYTRNNSSERCIPNGQENNCTSLPANAYWINPKFIQTWNWTSRTPTSHENTYSSDNNIECSFLCNTNYSRNTSSKTCEYKWSWWWGGGWWGWGWWSSSKNNNYIYLSTNRKSPSTNQFINLTIETEDNYTGKINFSKFQYKSSSSSSRSTISNKISNTYISDYSDTWEDWYYKMTSSDDGYVTLKNLVKFKKSGYYKIYVEDKYGNSDYIQFNVNSDSDSYSDNSYLKVKISPSNPDTYDWIKLTIETDDDYTGKIKFSKFQYKSSNSSSRSTISNRISNTYISDYSDTWEDWYYKMTSSDKGKATLKNLIKFKKNWYYKIYVEDTDDNESSVEFTVNSSTYNKWNETNDEKDDIEDKINNLLNWNWSTKNNSSSTNTTSNTNTTTTNTYSSNSQTTQNTNYWNDTYISRSCKPYTIYYITSLNAYTSPNLKKPEYFINIDYLKKYVDSKNVQNAECYNGWWINSPYIDNYTWSDRVTAPNGKIYFINKENWSFTSKQLTTAKSFSTIDEIKTYIKKHNPLSKI